MNEVLLQHYYLSDISWMFWHVPSASKLSHGWIFPVSGELTDRYIFFLQDTDKVNFAQYRAFMYNEARDSHSHLPKPLKPFDTNMTQNHHFNVFHAQRKHGIMLFKNALLMRVPLPRRSRHVSITVKTLLRFLACALSLSPPATCTVQLGTWDQWRGISENKIHPSPCNTVLLWKAGQWSG